MKCPTCSSEKNHTFYKTPNVPAHSVLLFRSAKEAINYPKGDIQLNVCHVCGFIWNTQFNPGLLNYSQEYEETQGFSPTFNTFHQELAEKLISKHQLHKKHIIEIGCGKGEFISLLCSLGENQGIGFDPAYVKERQPSSLNHRVEFIQDFFSEKFAPLTADFICCKMTLEHIDKTSSFLTEIKNSIAEGTRPTLFFQVPNTSYTLKKCAFWDIYYEHCSYFTEESIKNLFQLSGFRVSRCWTEYNDQYLMIEATPIQTSEITINPTQTLQHVNSFQKNVEQSIQKWKTWFKKTSRENKSVVLWGAGSKAVAFCSALELQENVAATVDINPYKKNTFLAGTGHSILLPEELKAIKPDLAIVMNPVYTKEIQSSLDDLKQNTLLTDVLSS